jgi:T-complex protein 1 subunit alpha
MAIPAPSGRLHIHGERQSGQDVRTQNVTAVSAIANIVKTSLGPVGLDKVMLASAALLKLDLLLF